MKQAEHWAKTLMRRTDTSTRSSKLRMYIESNSPPYSRHSLLAETDRDDPFANACQTGTVKSQHRNLPMGNAGK